MTSHPGALRVLVVTVVHDPQDARVWFRQARALLDVGCAVTFAAPFTAYGRPVPAEVEGIDLPRAHGRRRLHAVRAARRLLERRAAEFDVVLLHDPDLLLAASRRVRRSGAAVVWDVHEDTAAAVTMRAWIPRPLRALAAGSVRLAERWAERRLHLLLAEPGYVARFARPHPVVPNSVRVPAERPDVAVQDRVVYVGKVTAARGAREMVAVARRLDGVRVEVVGPATGEVADELRRADADGVLDWAGFQPNDVATARLDGALAGLSLLHDEPNYAHSQPTKVLEYMAHAVPVVTTPNATSVEVVTAADAGVVVGFGDVDAVVGAVQGLRADPARRERLARNAYAAARERYDWNRDATAFVAILEGFSARTRPAAAPGSDRSGSSDS